MFRQAQQRIGKTNLTRILNSSRLKQYQIHLIEMSLPYAGRRREILQYARTLVSYHHAES
jgi:hypothetical protein